MPYSRRPMSGARRYYAGYYGRGRASYRPTVICARPYRKRFYGPLRNRRVRKAYYSCKKQCLKRAKKPLPYTLQRQEDGSYIKVAKKGYMTYFVPSTNRWHTVRVTSANIQKKLETPDFMHASMNPTAAQIRRMDRDRAALPLGAVGGPNPGFVDVEGADVMGPPRQAGMQGLNLLERFTDPTRTPQAQRQRMAPMSGISQM
jgi:hypothetical protein